MDLASRSLVRTILLGFDFLLVHKLMTLMSWKWFAEVPSVLQLRRAARELLTDLIDHPDSSFVESGGLRAERVTCDGLETVRLTFEAVSFALDAEASEGWLTQAATA